MTIFGPQTFHATAQWTEILAEAGEDVNFLPLWYESERRGQQMPTGSLLGSIKTRHDESPLAHDQLLSRAVLQV